MTQGQAAKVDVDPSKPPAQTAGSAVAADAPPPVVTPPPNTVKPAAIDALAAPPPATKSEASPATSAPKTLSPPSVTFAEPVFRVLPQYPPAAGRMNAKGKVDLTVEVDDKGNVTSAKAISGPLVLRPVAEDALKKWRFKPATLRGANIKSAVNISVEFKQ
jgi:protein TonB